MLGGMIRLLPASESGGKPYCIELTEGIDMKSVDKDLIEQARLVLRSAQKQEIEFAAKLTARYSDAPNGQVKVVYNKTKKKHNIIVDKSEHLFDEFNRFKL